MSILVSSPVPAGSAFCTGICPVQDWRVPSPIWGEGRQGRALCPHSAGDWEAKGPLQRQRHAQPCFVTFSSQSSAHWGQFAVPCPSSPDSQCDTCEEDRDLTQACQRSSGVNQGTPRQTRQPTSIWRTGATKCCNVAARFCLGATECCNVAARFCLGATACCNVAARFCRSATECCNVAMRFCHGATACCTVAMRFCHGATARCTVAERFCRGATACCTVAARFCHGAKARCTVAARFCHGAKARCTVAARFCRGATACCTVATRFCHGATASCTVAARFCQSQGR